MRIRNRPAPSIFPPPPDLNLNRRSLFPSSSPPPKHQVLYQDDEDDATTPAVDYRAQSTRLPSADQPKDAARARRSVKMITNAKAAAATTSNNHRDDNEDAHSNYTSSWKDESLEEEHSTGMQPFSENKGIVKKGEALKRGSKVGALTMEGSRCSRVNGRGWRCSHHTLVGYSLCEHHLGKSRLRSLSSVKNVGTSNKDNFSVALSNNNKKKRLVFEESDDDEPLLISSGRKKSRIGTVKARSLSSLLSQTANGLGVSQPSSVHKRKGGK